MPHGEQSACTSSGTRGLPVSAADSVSPFLTLRPSPVLLPDFASYTPPTLFGAFRLPSGWRVTVHVTANHTLHWLSPRYARASSPLIAAPGLARPFVQYPTHSLGPALSTMGLTYRRPLRASLFYYISSSSMWPGSVSVLAPRPSVPFPAGPHPVLRSTRGCPPVAGLRGGWAPARRAASHFWAADGSAASC